MIFPEGMDGGTKTSMNDDLEEGESGADGICMKGKGRGSSEEAVHDIVGVRGKTDEEEELWALFDSAHDTFDGWVGIEPPGDGVAKERAGNYEYKEGASQGGKIRDDSASPRTKGISRQYNECRVEREWS